MRYLVIILSVLSVFLFVLPASSSISGELPWDSYFYTDGTSIKAEAGDVPCVFRGITFTGLGRSFGADIVYQGAYPGVEGKEYTVADKESFAQYKKWGFNSVRLALEWGRLTPRFAKELDPAYLSAVDKVIGWCGENKLYVLLDIHDSLQYWKARATASKPYPANVANANTDDEAKQHLYDTLALLAKHYADNKVVLGYELMNQPNPKQGGGDSNWPTIARFALRAVRSKDRHHLVFVDGRNWSSPIDGTWSKTNGDTPFVEDSISPTRLVFAVSMFYDGTPDGSNYFDATVDNARVDKALADLLAWSTKNKVPVAIAQSGIPEVYPSTSEKSDWRKPLEYAFTKYYDPNGWSFFYYQHDPWWQDGPTSINSDSSSTLPVLQKHPGGVVKN